MMMLCRLGGLIFIAFALSYAAAINNKNAELQDIEGGARRIFSERPANPMIVQTTQSNEHRTASGTNTTVTNDGVEDALALGNSARDAHPPRYDDAEKAYRLAARLNPNDARSYIGMGNIMYDQHRYVEAAKMYRQALSLLSAVSKGRRPGERGLQLNGDELASIRANYHAHLGMCLLQANQMSKAETEFLEAIGYSSKDARWYALLGYTYFLQNRFGEASSEFKTAIQLAPNTPVYREMLKRVTQ
jgi:Flp pilus assembly protein TadD